MGVKDIIDKYSIDPSKFSSKIYRDDLSKKLPDNYKWHCYDLYDKGKVKNWVLYDSDIVEVYDSKYLKYKGNGSDCIDFIPINAKSLRYYFTGYRFSRDAYLNIDVSNVRDFGYMFSGAYLPDGFDFGKFDTGKGLCFDYMFTGSYIGNCINLGELFTLSNNSTKDSMFTGCNLTRVYKTSNASNILKYLGTETSRDRFLKELFKKDLRFKEAVYGCTLIIRYLDVLGELIGVTNGKALWCKILFLEDNRVIYALRFLATKDCKDTILLGVLRYFKSRVSPSELVMLYHSLVTKVYKGSDEDLFVLANNVTDKKSALAVLDYVVRFVPYNRGKYLAGKILKDKSISKVYLKNNKDMANSPYFKGIKSKVVTRGVNTSSDAVNTDGNSSFQLSDAVLKLLNKDKAYADEGYVISDTAVKNLHGYLSSLYGELGNKSVKVTMYKKRSVVYCELLFTDGAKMLISFSTKTGRLANRSVIGNIPCGYLSKVTDIVVKAYIGLYECFNYRVDYWVVYVSNKSTVKGSYSVNSNGKSRLVIE